MTVVGTEQEFVLCVWEGLMTDFCTLCPKGKTRERKRSEKHANIKRKE